MKTEIEQLVEQLQLLPHPEGGFYKETYRSEETLDSKDRNLLTSIYFLLTSENISHFHRIKSDELWYFHAGSAVTVHTLDENGHTAFQLGPHIGNGELPFYLVKKDTIFGSTVDKPNSYALVSCAVAPGFDFRDFELFEREDLLQEFPENKEIVCRLTRP
jgi:predicted cupin superfamily sugar epimerase